MHLHSHILAEGRPVQGTLLEVGMGKKRGGGGGYWGGGRRR